MRFLRLALLGGFEAALASSGIPVVLPTKKAQALLAYCALQSGQAHQREKLATLLWGETGEANARNSLRQTLFVLRSALGESGSSILRIGRDTLGTDSHAIDVDVLSFERLAAERTPQSLEQAAALYRGDLLEGFVVDEDPFEEWLLQERERLRDLAMETLARLLQHQRVEGTARAAIQTARRLLALDPLQEAVHQILMRLLLQVGRPDEALNQYQACSRVLKRELGFEPEDETTQLRDTIVDGLRPATQGPTGELPPSRPARRGEIRPPTTGAARGKSALRGDGEAASWPRDEVMFRARQTRELALRLMAETHKRQLRLIAAFEDNSRHIMTFKRLMFEEKAYNERIGTTDPA